MSESAKERLAKMIEDSGRAVCIWPKAAEEIAAALLAAGVTLPKPVPEPEWRVEKIGDIGATALCRAANGLWDWRGTFPTESAAREYVARKLAKPLDVDALAKEAAKAAGAWPEDWRSVVRRVLELAGVKA